MSTEVPIVTVAANAPVHHPSASGNLPPNSSQQKRRQPRQNRPPNVQGAPKPPRRPRQPKDAKPSNEASTSSSVVDSGNEPRSSSQPRNPRKKPAQGPNTSDAAGNAPPPRNRRAANFGAGLTSPDAKQNQPARDKEPGHSRGRHLPQGDDLTSSLIRNLSTPPYPDCPICFSSIRPDQAIWSCSPSIPIVTSSENQVAQYCWTSFHVRCIRSWADKSVKEIADAWRARGEPDKGGDWRCPGCQAKREAVPSGYWCFCNSTSEPKRLRLATPHSCGNSCSRTRESGCGHPCPLQCHPGPCPPCQVTTRLECYCPKKNILTFRCGIDVRGKGIRDLSCHNVCSRTLNCAKHACEKICHEGDCGKCQRTELATCWCGKEQKTINCGEGKEIECFVEGGSPWIGKFTCDNVCERSFDCGKHKCQKPCHPPSSKPATCPRSPSKITHCPCGKNTIALSPVADASQYTFPARTDCSAPIPTCESTCAKPHPACSHPCTAKCHNGACPPCTVQIVRPCRCGGTTKSMPCHEVLSASTSSAGGGDGVEEKETLCDKPCQALRACGRHQCRRVCCPLASLAMVTGKKGKRRAVEDTHAQGIGEEQGGWHECDLVCGKMLSCGNHKCEQRDHKGVCPPCLRSSFEELVCTCGRTVYEPPIPCGTKIQCHYPCPRPAPPCGHPATPHSCHDHSISCPPCPYLADKTCACGKKVVSNVRCSLETEKVSCGTVCGKLMTCGFHHCERLCHGDECGTCTAPCGKSRKSCFPNHHPCTRPCHAPATCPETDPCQSIITLTCACGRIRQAVQCGRTASSSSSSSASSAAPKCTSECQIAKRNARLADALGINTDGRDKTAGGAAASYADDVVAFARANMRFLPVVEKAFADFVTSEKRTQVLPHMPPERRKFVHDLAAVYRMDTQMVDQEPHRSVQLLRRVDTRIPSPILSQYISSHAPPPSLGKLADFRSLKIGSAITNTTSSSSTATASWRSNATPKPATPPNTHRGWTSVVLKPAGPSMGTTAAAASTGGWGAVAAPRPAATLAGTTSNALLASQVQAPQAANANTPRAVSPAVVVSSVAFSNDPVPDDWEDDV